MKLAKALSVLGAALMFCTITYGFVMGDFDREGGILLGMPWGRVSLIDVYVGFAVFSAWIIYREKSWTRSLAWIALMAVLGNLTSCTYVFLALRQSDGDWRRFWMGHRAQTRTEARAQSKVRERFPRGRRARMSREPGGGDRCLC
jgi:hypothetical protein